MKVGTLSLVLVLSLTTALQAQERRRGEADITFGDATLPGVKVGAISFEKSTKGSLSSDAPPDQSWNETAAGVGPRPNMCTGLVSGTEFVAYNDSPVCSSFAAPRPPRAGPETLDPQPRLTPEDLALALMDDAVALAPEARLRIDPGRVGLTGLDSFFWVRPPRPIQVSASVPGFTVTAEARPAQYVWDFGDGASRTTGHPGRAWSRRRPGNIAHLYEARGTYSVAVEIVWAARWRVGSGEWRELGFFSTSDARDYPVREVVALLVKPR